MSRTPQEDLALLRARLVEVEAEASELPWSAERPWRATSHVRLEGELLQVDLHDLNARCARHAVRKSVLAAEALSTGALGFITGVGSHSIGPGVLGDVVFRELREFAPRRGWSYRPNGKGAFILVTDPDRAPALASARLPPLFWLIAALFLGAVAWLEPLTLIPMVLVALLLLWRRGSRRAGRG